MSKPSAQDRRLDAIKLVSEGAYGRVEIMNAEETEALAQTIEALASLGRTERWALAINNWAGMVRDQANPRAWALLQGSIFAAHAA